VKQWRQRRKELALQAQGQMIQDERASFVPLKKPIYKLIFLLPGGLKRQMIQDEIVFQRLDSRTFMAAGGAW